MQYNPDLEVIIAMRADGGAVSSTVYPTDDPNVHYHYLCAFDDEKYARNFVQQKLNTPVFFTKKKISDLVKEFNSSIVWPGLTGVAFIHADDMVEHVDVGQLVKMAFNDMVDMNQRYGCELVCYNKIQSVEDRVANTNILMGEIDNRIEAIVRQLLDIVQICRTQGKGIGAI